MYAYYDMVLWPNMKARQNSCPEFLFQKLEEKNYYLLKGLPKSSMYVAQCMHIYTFKHLNRKISLKLNNEKRKNKKNS